MSSVGALKYKPQALQAWDTIDIEMLISGHGAHSVPSPPRLKSYSEVTAGHASSDIKPNYGPRCFMGLLTRHSGNWAQVNRLQGRSGLELLPTTMTP